MRTRRQSFPALLVVLALLTVAGCGVPGRGPDTGADSRQLSDEAWRAAMAQVKAEAQADPGQVYWPHREAELYAAADSTGRAVMALQRALSLDADYNPSLSLLSKIHFDDGRHAEAIDMLEAARVRQGELPEALRLGLALHYEAVGRWEESEAVFQATPSRPTSPVIYHMLRGEGFLGAADLAEAALREQPDSAANHNNFGITRLYAGDPDGARSAFLRALELDAAMAGAMYNLAIVETFYFFDEAAGREWFERYRQLGALDDPDGLGEVFAAAAETLGEEQARR